MRAKIWFPERQVIEDHDVDHAAAFDLNEVETVEIEGVVYVLTPIVEDPNADFTASRKGVA
ncbi:hypothetical protein [Mesorhizobium sp. M0767]|uniref:hypothetical protein n=1 Tax=Mesorhizobium sp. M0767 TaxID=2956995 RepID=UPI003337B43C